MNMHSSFQYQLHLRSTRQGDLTVPRSDLRDVDMNMHSSFQYQLHLRSTRQGDLTVPRSDLRDVVSGSLPT